MKQILVKKFPSFQRFWDGCFVLSWKDEALLSLWVCGFRAKILEFITKQTRGQPSCTQWSLSNIKVLHEEFQSDRGRAIWGDHIRSKKKRFYVGGDLRWLRLTFWKNIQHLLKLLKKFKSQFLGSVGDLDGLFPFLQCGCHLQLVLLISTVDTKPSTQLIRSIDQFGV